VQTFVVGGIAVRVFFVIEIASLSVNFNETGQIEAVVEAILQIMRHKYAIQISLDIVGMTVVLEFLASPRRHTLFVASLSRTPVCSWKIILCHYARRKRSSRGSPTKLHKGNFTGPRVVILIHTCLTSAHQSPLDKPSKLPFPR
jgi:hypothetical protein